MKPRPYKYYVYDPIGHSRDDSTKLYMRTKTDRKYEARWAENDDEWELQTNKVLKEYLTPIDESEVLLDLL